MASTGFWRGTVNCVNTKLQKEGQEKTICLIMVFLGFDENITILVPKYIIIIVVLQNDQRSILVLIVKIRIYHFLGKYHGNIIVFTAVKKAS